MVHFIKESAREFIRREPPVVLESKPLDIPEDFESRRVIEEKIIEALKEESVSTIAIYGVGGVGKTRMARRIGEKVKRDKLFEVVVMVTLGPGPNLQRISYEIFGYMDVHVRPEGDNVVALVKNEYLFGLLSERRVLIILDDVWESLELEEDGIPWQMLLRSCKIMITSRFEGVCSAMEADRIFMVQGLTKEEAWILLREKIGHSIEFSNLYPLARFVSETYRWFPGHLVAVARILKALSTLWPRINSQKIADLASVYGRVQPSKMLDQTSFYEKQAVTLVSQTEIQGQAQPRTKRMWLRQEFAITKIWPETLSPGEMTLLGNLKYLFWWSQLEMGNPYSCKVILHRLPFASSVLGGMIMGRMLNQEDLAEEWKRSRSLSTTKGRYKSKQEIGLNPPRSRRSELGENQGNEDDSATQLSTKTNGNEGQKEQRSQESKLKTSSDIDLQGQRLKNLVSFCSVFPSDYVFTRDVLVWQWIATGLVGSGQDETMEEVCNQCFDTLLNSDEIVPCGYDYHFEQMKYKFGDSLKACLQKQHLEPKFKKYLDDERANLTEVEHLSLAVKDTVHIKFDILKQCICLNTLIVHCCYDCKLKRIPDDLFLELKTLKNLNLSGTGIVELPRSIENLADLGFLDVSETPIMRLPESLETFGNLLMLKLDGCLSLTNLPKSMNKLTSLCHLVFDVARQLESMPIGFGKLVNLRTLQAFLVGENEGYHIGELKDMNKLRGSLCILNLENVMSKEEAREACLSRKVGLEKIELQWSDLHDEKNPDEEGILQYLEPPFSIQELKIFFYSGGVLPTWVSNPSFYKMVSITFYRCRYLSSLPSLGELPSLKVLNIVKNNEVKEINRVFCRKGVNHNHVAFPKLEKLSFVSMTRLKSWIEVKNGDFPLLQHLAIKYCPEFAGLPILSYMISLLHIEIRSCPLLSCLPEDGLSPKLDCLMINDCPNFKKRFGNKQCEDWSKVAHVPSLYFDNQKV